MTSDKKDASLSALIIRYSENEKAIAAHRSDLQEMARGFERLTPRLYNAPHAVTPEGEAFKIINDEMLITVDGNALREMLRDYQEALEAKSRMESCLTQAGLANIITPQK